MRHTREGNWKGDILVADIEESEQMDTSEIHARRLNAKEVLTPMKGEKFIFPIADGTVKLSGGDQVSENIHLNPGSPRPRRCARKSSRRLRRIFFNPTSRLILVWWWCLEWILVHFRQLYLPSSRLTESQTVRAERSVILNSTEIHRRDQGYTYILGCNAGENIDD